jgi:hypothetical protein
MPIALYFDVHVDSAIVNQLRLRNVDVLRSQDDDTDTLSDELLLKHATVLGRPLVTNDIRFHAMAGGRDSFLWNYLRPPNAGFDRAMCQRSGNNRQSY